MKLWLLQRNNGYNYDQADGFVVRAELEENARDLASEFCHTKEPEWRDSKKTSCVELAVNGSPEVIICDYIEP